VRIKSTDTLEVVSLPRIGNTPPHVEILQPKRGYLIYFPLDEVGQLRKALKRIREQT
jgi:hypothetical protein